MSSDAKIDKLTRQNYDTWQVHMKCVLQIHKIWGVVDGTDLRPDPTDDNRAAVLAWNESDQSATARILLAISAGELKQVKSLTSAREIWLKLEAVYADRTPVGKMTLLRDILTTRLGDKGDPKEFLDTFFERVEKLAQYGLNLPEELFSMLLILALPKSYDGLVSAIESRDALPKIDDLRLKILHASKSREIRRGDGGGTSGAPDASESGAMHVKRPGKPKKKKPATQPASTSTAPPKQKTEKAHFPFKCYNCGKNGHRAMDCLSAKQPGAAGQISGPNSFACTHVTVGENCSLSTTAGNSSSWLLDSGATSHMTSYREVLKDFSECGGKLSLASKDTTFIAGKGSATFTPSDGVNEPLPVPDVLHVPELRANLLSVSKIADRDNSVLFTKTGAIVWNSKGQLLARAARHGNLYVLHDAAHRESKSQASVVVASGAVTTHQMWHERFGHLNMGDLNSMSKSGNVVGMKLGKAPKDIPICKVCVEGKATVKPFPKSEHKRASLPLELVHSDLCGPMRTESNGGRFYFMTFIDDCTRYCEVMFLRQKSDALAAFKEFKAAAEKRTGQQVKSLQSDGGGEFVNAEFNNFLKDCGIQKRTSVPYTPQQNGVAERKNRTLMEMARCLLIQSGLPNSFWAEAVRTACYLRNRCVSRSLDGKTPYELWWSKKPDVAHLRRFGEKAMVLKKRGGRDKLDAKAFETVFVGYSENAKAWRFVERYKNIVHDSRDAEFLGHYVGTEWIQWDSSSVDKSLYRGAVPSKDVAVFPLPDCEGKKRVEQAPETPTPGSFSPVKLGANSPVETRNGEPARTNTIPNVGNDKRTLCSLEELTQVPDQARRQTRSQTRKAAKAKVLAPLEAMPEASKPTADLPAAQNVEQDFPLF